ncbi:branched-chain amino acid ABC transporter permease [Paenirhodobacter populi]|uniref:Branched-chain amino acid ABC transporter permease n=1 Tax=Paenirhodobacter populi TaxID=2306993 RepID=A0A443JIP5_9RHOB|nr:branched-chain amino acid ABC transporter permease [Sinirhodobacter populi]RWR09571.1 branched-chain amino acid ABC transporter permease [Sinirhodobacter populi]RWR10325.1 branched-chain amino acid ABC transporter permease [Sinirhodobacter populi]RWR20445.1 branched-chain amino acid ABC transporter permease [Sinirhodobacter populi]
MDIAPYLLLATLEGLVQASVLMLTALGLSLVFGVMRVVNVAHGEFYMLGAVGAWLCATLIPGHPAISFAVALIVAPLIVGLLAALADRAILQRINYNPEATIVSTIGISYIIQQLTLMTFGPDARAVDPPFYYNIRFPWFGYSSYKFFIIGVAVALVATLWLLMKHSKMGLLMRATQYDRETALNFGIPVGRVYSAVFAFGAMMAAVAGVLVVPNSQAHYLMGHDPLLMSFIVVIVGGLGSIPGTIAAAVLIGLSDGLLSVFFSPTLAKIASTLLVALVLVFKPQGLFGKAGRI